LQHVFVVQKPSISQYSNFLSKQLLVYFIFQNLKILFCKKLVKPYKNSSKQAQNEEKSKKSINKICQMTRFCMNRSH